jgi:serine/threonine protein kinase/tetratricopeptide (TPR) repeat protein
MGQLTPEQFARAEKIYHEVMTLPTADRGRAVESACGGDTALMSEVASLVEAAGGDVFLDEPIADLAGIWSAAEAAGGSDALVGTALGEYDILERLGSGGMGVVYRARQRDPSREVAIKLMRPGAISPSLVRRFEHEAEILARLQHPGIASIYRAGRIRTERGVQPYFAMELVRGVGFLEYAAGLDMRGKLELVALVCDAVQHAHTKGVVHRDLKPANILVVPWEGPSSSAAGTMTPTKNLGQPKVLDFGVARVFGVDGRVSMALTAQTSAGEIVGTLAYMSPEQIDPSAPMMGEGVDTRTDVYALGVILYQVMSGRLPIDLSDKSIAQAAALIAGKEPPLLGTLDRSLRGDVETIAATCLEKDRSRRYQSAGAVAEDLRRTLADAPILARPPTAWYQVRKFARRNRVLVGGAVLAAVLLVAGIVGTSVGLLRAREAAEIAKRREREAREALAEAERTTGFLTTMLESANPMNARGRKVTVDEVLDVTATRAGLDLAEFPGVESRTRVTLARTYLSLFSLDKASREADLAASLAEKTFGGRSVEYSRAQAVRAAVAQAKRKGSDALRISEEVLALRLELLPADDALIGHARYALAKAHLSEFKLDDAEREFALAQQILERAGDREAIACVTARAEALIRRPSAERRAPEAERLLRTALSRLKEDGPSADPDRATILASLGLVLIQDDREAEAEAPLRQAIELRNRIYPAGHPATFTARLRLASALRNQRRWTDAKDLLKPLIEEQRRSLGDSSPELVNSLSTLGTVLSQMGEHEEAGRCFEEHLRIVRTMDNRVGLLVSMQLMGENLIVRGKFAESETIFREAVGVLDASGSRASSGASYRLHLAQAVAAQGRHTDAVEILVSAAELAGDGTHQPELRARIVMLHAAQNEALGDKAEASRRYAEAAELFEKVGLPEDAAACRTKAEGLRSRDS